MNKKGQVGQVGTLIMVALTLIVGCILLVASAQNVGQTTQTVNVVNRSLGTQSNTTTLYLTDMKAISDVVVWNTTTQLIPAGNYTVTNNVVYNGGLSVSFLPSALPDRTNYTWYISGTAQPTTYESNAGGRAIAGLIIIFFALAIGVIALTPALRSGIIDLVSR